MKKVSVFYFVLAMLFFASCGDGNDDFSQTDDSEVSDSDEEPVDEDESVEMTKEPEDDFYKPKLNLVMEFEGMINSTDDVLNNEVTNGEVSLTLEFNDYKEDAFTTQPYVYTRVIDDSTTILADYIGSDLLVGGVFSDDIVQEDGFVKYKSLYFGLLVDKLKEGGVEEKQEISMDGFDFINYMSVQYKKRADEVILRKSCMLAMKKKDSTDSKYFIDFSGSGDFGPGDTLHFFANLELEYDVEAIKTVGFVEDNEKLCKYKMDGEDIAKDVYEVEVEKSGIELGCDLPDLFNELPEDNFVDITFKGEITSSDNTQKDFGKTVLMLDGESIVVDDYQSSAYRWTSQTDGELLIIESMGGIKAITGNEYFEYKTSRLIIPINTLSFAFKEGDESCHIIYGEDTPFFYNYDRNEQKVVGDVENFRACTIAIPAEVSPFVNLFFCTKENSDFSVGEKIEMRGIVSVSSDEEWLKEVYGADTADELCQCYNRDGVFDCALFDSLGE